ncbi:hypothetical protein C1I97_21925 [Streptomyces sp. NTH33]|uniref:hypothetical protein n=1 Tax=Streptomyces sp. NTH33 TaxID=1735453 RepID=UPI000DA7983D|nr:hypothetical protein [Streptomyces sp. NTH33]PZH02124.1 hypothetical protein C1I97_21925 [Streptomyces sp. NTH33]
MTAERDGADALMAAITGEPLPDEARADAAFLAGHRAAEADVALLRQQLGVIGDALAGDTRPRRKPVPAARNRRRVRTAALGALAAAAAATVLSGTAWLVTQSGGVADSGASAASGTSADKESGAKADSSAGSPFASPGYLACARLVAEGEVTDVERVPGAAGRERITLHVTRSYKPAKTAGEITFVLGESAGPKSLHKSDHVLVALPRHAASPDHADHADHVVVGDAPIARERDRIARALPEARELGCE